MSLRKQLVYVGGFIIAFYSLSSCRKEYSCVCTNPGGAYVAFTTKNSKSGAEKQCDDYYEENFGDIPWNETFCEVK